MKIEKSQTTYSEYQKTVRKLTWQRFKKDHPIFDLLTPLVIGVLVGLWESLKLVGKIELLTTGLVTAIITFLIYSVLYLWYFSREHVYIYSDQSKRIEQFWPESLDIQVYYDSDMRELVDDMGNKIASACFSAKNGSMRNRIIELTAEIKSISQTSFDPDTGEVMTLPFFAERKVIWENGEILVNLRPDQSMSFNLAYLNLENPSRLRFGEGGFFSWLFEREAIYQFSIEFVGKIEGEVEFRRSHYMDVIYANPPKNKLIIAYLAKELRMDKIPKKFLKIIETAEKGYWYDYSSPFRKQQAQKQRESKSLKK